MKQQLRSGIVFNLLILSLSVLVNIRSQAYGTEKPVEPTPATTVKQWRSQLNDSVANITEIEVRSRFTSGIEIVLNTDKSETLQAIRSTAGNNLIIDIPNARLQLPESEFVRQNPTQGISEVKAIALSGNRIRVIISGVDGVPTGETVRTAAGLTIGATPAVPVAETAEPDRVIDIIVTAQKQPEKLQDVPISLTTLSQQEIEDARIDSFRDVAANTPNFFTTLGDRTFNFQTIRGLTLRLGSPTL